MKITRIVEFDAAHRVMKHESKCATLHGHRYKVEITAEASQLDPVGRVIDFSVLKDRIGGWIEERWDHTTLLNHEDTEVLEAVKKFPGFKQPFALPYNPTAERMAAYLLCTVCPPLMAGTGVTVTKIKIWETPNCWAECEL